jgi:glutaredoxin-like protein NrdH
MSVIVYSKNNCINCTATKNELNKRGVNFTEINMSTNRDALLKVKAMKFREAPVVVTDNDAWSGHNMEKINMHWPSTNNTAVNDDDWDF